jgi:hypothetical protein
MEPVSQKTISKQASTNVSDGASGAGLTFLPNFPYLGTPYSGHNVPA